jgi:hypothetical protein
MKEPGMIRFLLLVAAVGCSLTAASEGHAQFGIAPTFQYQPVTPYAVPSYQYVNPYHPYVNPYQSFYSAPYRSQAYPHGVSRLGPTYYPTYRYQTQRVRVYNTPARSSTFGGAHSSHYFGSPTSSHYFPQ